MNLLFKVGFFVIAGIFIVAVIKDAGISFSGSGNGFSGGSHELTDRSSYLRSYDENNDGVVSDEEYRLGELARIEAEIEAIEKGIEEGVYSQNTSPYAGMIELQSGNMWTDVRNEEYVQLEASDENTSPIAITGWVLKSLISGRDAKIRNGVRVLTTTRTQFGADTIYLAPGDTAIVSTGGAAGIRTSFLTNECSGYLDTGDRFSPSLSSQCPLLEEENLSRFDLGFDDFDDEDDYDECLDAIESVGQCEQGDTPSGITRDCREFIEDYGTYAGCVKLHRNDLDFLGTEWRIFLNETRELWRDEREAIGLFDAQGKLVDVWRY